MDGYNYIVVWSTGNASKLKDHWQFFEDRSFAQQFYDREIPHIKDLYTSSLCRVLNSTDYEGSEEH